MGKITVITGGTSGIGRGIAEKILAESAKADRIFVTYGHDEKKALSFQESLPEEKRSQVTLIKADMSSYDEMMAFVEELKKRADHIDWLVSNAGISTYAKYEDYSFEEWTRIVNTNLSVPVFMVKELRPMMVEGGSVLFTGSYAGQQAYSSSLVYGVTKAAIHFLTKSLVKEFEPKGITVNAIAPGFIKTDMTDVLSDKVKENISASIPMGSMGTAEDVAKAAAFLASDGARYITGQVLRVDGGMAM